MEVAHAGDSGFAINTMFDRVNHPPRGRDGGRPGRTGRIYLKSGAAEFKGKGRQVIRAATGSSSRCRAGEGWAIPSTGTPSGSQRMFGTVSSRSNVRRLTTGSFWAPTTCSTETVRKASDRSAEQQTHRRSAGRHEVCPRARACPSSKEFRGAGSHSGTGASGLGIQLEQSEDGRDVGTSVSENEAACETQRRFTCLGAESFQCRKCAKFRCVLRLFSRVGAR